MRILDRLVLGSFLRLFGLSVLAVPTLFVVGNITERLDRYLESGLSIPEIAIGIAYRVPEFVAWSFPIAGLVAGVFTVHSMTTHREIVAAKAGGVSFHRLLLPVFVMGLFVAAVGMQLAEVVPVTNRMSSDILERTEGQVTDQSWRTDFVYRSEYGIDLAVRRLVVAEGSLSGVLATWKDGDTSLHLQSESATWLPDEGGWWFRAGILRTIWPDGSEQIARFERMSIPALVETPEDFLLVPRDADEMTRPEIQRQARIVERSGGKPNELLVELEERLALPAATLVILLFGAPLATSNKRGGAAWGVGISLASTLLYLVLERIASGFGNAGLIDPLLAAWLPNLCFLMMGAILLSRVRT